jgi:hypothetical protein
MPMGKAFRDYYPGFIGDKSILIYVTYTHSLITS